MFRFSSALRPAVRFPRGSRHFATRRRGPTPTPFSDSDLRALQVPPISQRLKPLIPLFIWWSIITSLTVHLLQIKKRSEAELSRAHAQESVLRGLRARFEAGEAVPDTEIRRELEMVGLRERTQLTADLQEELAELKDVSWWEVLLGRKRRTEGGEEETPKEAAKSEQEIVKEWTQIVNEASAPASPRQADPLPVQRAGVARRAESSTVYM